MELGGRMSWMNLREVKCVTLFISFVILNAYNGTVFADTRYVSDRLIISVRTGQNTQNGVLGYIQSGTPVDVLEEDGQYLKIKTENGLEGWVQAQYIISEKPKALIIMDLRNTINNLKERIETFKNRPIDSSNEFSTAKQNYEARIHELERTLKANQQMTSNTKKELEKLRKEKKKLQSEIYNLKKQKNSPLESRSIQWFLAGAGVLLFGFIIGRSLRREKRASLYR